MSGTSIIAQIFVPLKNIMYKVSETVLPIYINGQCPIIKTCSDVTLNLSSKDSKLVLS